MIHETWQCPVCPANGNGEPHTPDCTRPDYPHEPRIVWIEGRPLNPSNGFVLTNATKE